MCKVSVILPSLNVAQYIDECLRSVTAQTLREIEIICVDAGSTDGTLDIIRSYAQRDSRVTLILSDKKSYGHQMNLGIARARGEYIGIVETDDFVPADMYEALYQTAVGEQADIVKADFYRFRTVGDALERRYNRLDPSGRHYGKVLCPAEHPEVFRFEMNTWSGIYLRRFLENNGILHQETPGASYQDTGFWFRTFCLAKRVVFVDTPYYMNRRDNEHSSVASGGKLYCMTQELAAVEAWLRGDAARLRAFSGVFALRKFHSLLFTYNRIAPQYRAEYAEHIREQMAGLIEAGEYDRALFAPHEWRKLMLILRNPARFHRLNGSGAMRMLEKAEAALSFAAHEGPAAAVRRVIWKNKKDKVGKESVHG